LYLYRSGYGQAHPLGYGYTFQGNPVGQRLGTNLYRTVHFNFSPIPMDQTSMQVVVNRIFDWLYDPTLSDLEQPVGASRYGDGRVHISLSDAQERYRQRMQQLDNMLSEENNLFNFK